MSSVSFGSVLRCGALSAVGPAEEPFLEPSRDPEPAVADLLRLRRRRADRLVPVPVPAVAVFAPLGPVALSASVPAVPAVPSWDALALSRDPEPPPEPWR
jgi:hypothetical protein